MVVCKTAGVFEFFVVVCLLFNIGALCNFPESTVRKVYLAQQNRIFTFIYIYKPGKCAIKLNGRL